MRDVVRAHLRLGAFTAAYFIEFIATLVLETNVGGYDNTGWDRCAEAGAGCGEDIVRA
ncbi:MAG: hypothetical protein ACRD2W_02530 [Acidimicrobiales bacterium]